MVFEPVREQCVSEIFRFPNYRPESRKHNFALLKLTNENLLPAAFRSTICLPDNPEDEEKGALDPRMVCVITSWRQSLDESTLLAPHYKVEWTRFIELDFKTLISSKFKLLLDIFMSVCNNYWYRYFQLATPHRRHRCKAFDSENLICTDGKGFGKCKGSNGSSLSCKRSDGTWAIYGTGAIVQNTTCEKGQGLKQTKMKYSICCSFSISKFLPNNKPWKGKSVSEFTDVARHIDWIRETISESDTPSFTEVYSDWSQWSECDKFCDGGLQTRTRNCSMEAFCENAVEIQRRVCNTIKCQTLFGFRSAAGYKSGKGRYKVFLSSIFKHNAYS